MALYISGSRRLFQRASQWVLNYLFYNSTLHDADFSNGTYIIAHGVTPIANGQKWETDYLTTATLHDANFSNSIYNIAHGVTPLTNSQSWEVNYLTTATLHDANFSNSIYNIAHGVTPLTNSQSWEVNYLTTATIHDTDFIDAVYSIAHGVTPLTNSQSWEVNYLTTATIQDTDFIDDKYEIAAGINPLTDINVWKTNYLTNIANQDLNFSSGTYGVNGMTTAFTDIASVTRNGPAFMRDTDGLYTSVAVNTLRQSNIGALIESTSTCPGPHNTFNDTTYGAIASDGIELITNPWMTTDLTGWTDKSTGTGSSAWNNPGMAVQGGSSGVGIVETSFSVVAGNVYTIQFTSETNNVTVRIGTTSGGQDIQADTTVSASARFERYTAASNQTWYLQFRNSSNNVVHIYSISAQKFRFPVFAYGSGFGGSPWSTSSRGIMTVTTVGTTNGLPSFNLRIYRPNSVTSGGPVSGGPYIYFNGSGYTTATNGDTWTISAFVAIVGGSTANFSSISLGEQERTSGGSAVGSGKQTSIMGSLTSSLQRFTFPVTLVNGATTARINPGIVPVYTQTGDVDITLQLAGFQFENNNIPTTVASGTVTNAGSGLTDGTRTFTVTNGTGTSATQFTATVSGGVITSGITITVPGLYTVFPTIPTMSVDSGIVGGAAFTLTPSNMSAQGHASSPILTLNGSVTRNSDVIVEFLTGTPSGSVVLWGVTPTYNGTTTAWTWDDGSTLNCLTIQRDVSNHLRAIVTYNGTQEANLDLGVVANNTAFKLFFSWASNSFAAILNGGSAVVSNSGTVPTSLVRILYGTDSVGNYWNSYITHHALFSSALSVGTGGLLTS